MKTRIILLSSILAFAVYGCGSSGSTDEPGNGDASVTDAAGGGATDSGRQDAVPTTDGATEGSSGSGDGSDTSDADPSDGTAQDVATDIDWTYEASPAEAGEACVDQEAEAQRIPLDIYFMMDRSGSMGSDCNVTPGTFVPSVNSKWCRAINAIAGYVSSAQSAGNKAAIQYFSIGSGTCSGDGYDSAATSFDVLDGTSGGHAATIIASLNGTNPSGGTPTQGALNGIARFTSANRTADRTIIGILITDGQPWGCSDDNNELRGIAANHFASTGIHTFMVGMTGASFNSLEHWASYSGAISHPNDGGNCGNGAATCHHYNVGDGHYDVFVRALNAIQNSVLGCTFSFKPPEGVLDLDRVVVDYYPNGADAPVSLKRKTDRADCGGDDGWYFDNNTTPTRIELCPKTCTTVRADSKAKVKIRIACQGS